MLKQDHTLSFSAVVQRALQANQPVVALESTIITHIANDNVELCETLSSK